MKIEPDDLQHIAFREMRVQEIVRKYNIPADLIDAVRAVQRQVEKELKNGER